MNTIRCVACFAALTAMVWSAAAAQTHGELGALKSYRNDIGVIQRTLSHCKPIYNGHLAKTLNALQQAAKVIDLAIAAQKSEAPPVESKPKSGAAKPAGSASGKPRESAPPVKKPEPDLADKAKEVAESQARFREGLKLLQETIGKLKVIEPSLSADDGKAVANYLQAAEAEAKAGIELHAKEG